MKDELTKTNLTPTESSQHMTETERPVRGSKQNNLMSPCQAGGLCGLCSDRQRVHLSASMNNTEKEREKEYGGRLSTSSVERVQMCSYHKSTPMMHFLGQSVGSQCSCVPERANSEKRVTRLIQSP